MKLLHIGLTKTGSTSLRRYIFPKIAEKLKINFLDIPDLPEKLLKSENFEKSLPKNFIISRENLFAQNHEFNDIFKSFNIIKKNFSKDTIILIVLRNPYELLNSLFLTSIHSLNINQPENFFYINEVNKKKIFNKYNLYNFDYNKLINLYKENFDKVIVVKYEEFPKLNFLKKIFDIDENFCNQLEKTFKNNIVNRSISKNGINFILFLSKYLNLKKFDQNCRKKIIPSNNILIKVKNKLYWWLLIREFFQFKYDKVFSYKKYYINKSFIPINIDKLIEDYKNSRY